MNLDPAALPERVRARVAVLAADALAALPPEQVPAALRRVATFAPSRRVRAAGAQLLSALATDAEFRQHLAVQVRARQTDLVAALETGERSTGTAALAVLLGTEGWADLVAEAADVVVADPRVAVLEERLGRQEAELGELRRAMAGTSDALAAEQASVRQRIGDARARSRAELAASETARAEAEQRAGAGATELVAALAELRSLTERAEALEAELARTRRRSRVEREAGTMRARLLLDTLLQAGQGLRQELGLPVVEGAPADLVVADLAGPGVRMPSGTESVPWDDPSRLRELLGLPGFHLIVDGYNVTRDSWEHQTLEEQRTRLLRGLAPIAARTGVELTVVFDGANADARPPVVGPRGVRVVFSPRGVIADDVIRDLVAAEPPGRPIGVVTSDQEIVRSVTRRAGVYAVAARALVRLLA